MDLKNKLTTLIISNVLPADERLIAERLITNGNIGPVLTQLLASELIVVPSKEIPSDVYEGLSRLSSLSIGMFPDSPTGIMSTSPMLTAKHMASSVCSLCKKLFGTGHHLKGVLSFHAGIYVNDIAAPGAIIWKLSTCNFITLTVSSFDIILSAAYIDSFTMSPRLSSLMVSDTCNQETMPPSQLIERAWAVVRGRSGNVPSEWDMKSLVESVLPAAYLKASPE